jgi:hypothetical protein
MKKDSSYWSILTTELFPPQCTSEYKSSVTPVHGPHEYGTDTGSGAFWSLYAGTLS